MFSGFSHTVIGESHEARGVVCQDSSAFRTYDDLYSIAVVADGHGSKKHFRSDVGSEMAVKAALDTVEDYYKDVDAFETSFLKNPDKTIKKIEKSIITRWNTAIFRHYRQNPVCQKEREQFTDEEFEKLKTESIYGTTLIMGVISRYFSFGIQIGDGSLVLVFEDGTAAMPILDDESCPANVTASMSNSQAIDLFNSFNFTEEEQPLAIFVSTDGLFTSFRTEDDFLEYHTIITSQLENEELFIASVRKNMEKRAKFGTQDDISLSGIYDMDNVIDNIDVIKETVEENRKMAKLKKAEKKANMQKQLVKNSLRQTWSTDEISG